MPAGHSVVALDPVGQYAPISHTSPVVPSVGVGLDAPRMQKYPLLHRPAGADNPSLSQYIPPVQGWHSDEALRFVLALKVPLWQGYSVEKRVPLGQ